MKREESTSACSEDLLWDGMHMGIYFFLPSIDLFCYRKSLHIVSLPDIRSSVTSAKMGKNEINQYASQQHIQ